MTDLSERIAARLTDNTPARGTPYFEAPRVDISNMRRSDNVEDMRPNSVAEYMYNMLMPQNLSKHFDALVNHPFEQASVTHDRELAQRASSRLPPEYGPMSQQLGLNDAPGHLDTDIMIKLLKGGQ